MAPDTVDPAALLVQELPLLDVRAPVEFHAGAIPGAINLPLMDDDERHRIGLCYKQHGPEAALALGHRLVSGERRDARIQAWLDFVRARPDGVLYCFRGGQRSAIAQRWLYEAGAVIPRVAGGYKAMRRRLLDTLECMGVPDAFPGRFWVLGGLTGTGKTEVLQAVPQLSVDLEAHAVHRGSSFGRQLQAQPAQADFENALAVDFLRRRQRGDTHFLLEDESRFIGRCSLPPALYARMQAAPLIWLEAPLQERVDRIRRDYVVGVLDQLRARHDAATAHALLSERLLESLERISRRLGGQRHAQIRQLMAGALQVHGNDGDPQAHDAWIASLLSDYYDPMYASQARAKAARIVFRGPRDAILEWLRARGAGPVS